jgi:hypothetical protein
MPIEDPCVIRLLAEGAGIQVFGRKDPDGTWSFIGYAATMEIEDDGDDSVRVGGIPRCKNLSETLPDSYWIRFIPMYVHPELREWFRSRYDAAVATLPQHRREWHDTRRHHKWQAMFESTPPDRWSTEDTF